ncbi:MAG: ABC transporter substrate-binding protein [Acetobacteraceae bacterium]
MRGDHLTLERSPTYHRAGLPYLDKIILKDIPDSAARVLALQAGEIDMVEELYFPLNFYKTISADNRFQLQQVGYGADDLVIFNIKHPPFDNAAVRQALLVASDRDYLFRNVYFSQGPMAFSSFDTRLTWARNPAIDYNKMYAYDPARARKMLDDAGFKPGPDGTRFTLNLVFQSSRAEDIQMAQVLQRNWQAVGVKVVLKQTEPAVYGTRIFTDYDFDATIANYSTGGDAALGVSRLYTTDSIHKGSVFINASQYSNPEVDDLFNKGRDAASQAERAKYYFQVQEVLARDLPVLTMHEQAQYDAADVQVQDLFKAAHYPWWDQVWMKK